MSTDRETTRIVRSWLEDGVTRLPDNVLDAVLDELPSTHQRRSGWTAWRPFEMNKTLAFSAAAAAVVIAAVVGTALLGPSGLNFGAPAETPIPTPTPEPRVLLEGAKGPGTFSSTPFSENPVENPPQITFDMPDGWTAGRGDFVGADSGGGNLFFLQPSGLYSDPCLENAGAPDVAIGSTADEFASALAAHTSYDATRTSGLTIGGHDAIRMELLTPSGLDYTTCENGQFWVWDAPLYSEGANVWNLWIVDLDGTTVVLLSDVTGATAGSVDEVEQIVQSIRIDS